MPLAGQVIKASDILSRHGGTWYRSANQLIANAGLGTPISWDTEDDDSDGYLAAHATTGTTFTVPSGRSGLYIITAHVLATDAGGISVRGFVEIVPTAATIVLPAQLREPIDVTEDRAVVAALLPLDAGDSFTVNVFHNSGASKNFTGWLSAYQVSF